MDCPSNAVNGQTIHGVPLPNELWTHAIGYLSSKQDLARICLVSSLFNAIAIPFLYHTVDIRITKKEEWIKQQRFLINLSSPRFSDLVTRFDASISCIYRRRHGRPHLCDANDKDLGRAIKAFKNLKTLRFRCDLCQASGRHLYLLNDLPTRTLKEFGFSCNCTNARNTDNSIFGSNSLPTAPHMQTVTSLSLHCSDSWLIGANGTIHNVLQRNDALPLLKLWCYEEDHLLGSVGFPDEFLISRPITRFYYKGELWTFEERIKYCAKLDCLLIDHRGTEFIMLVIRHPGAFANLKHLGVLCLPSCNEDSVLEELGPLTNLKLLNTIEIERTIVDEGSLAYIMGPHDVFNPSQSLLQRLKEEHHSLCRLNVVNVFHTYAYLQGSTLWEWRPDGTWAGRAIPDLSRWEVLNGGLDSV
ncbi:hypothetical protein M408DRAFT_330431 [Serendipita vermifera MAFF 305830]|uniref:F-box domain-containing protein n=1 Tax=Serendipita vermifera MAFF 305830 TaxID=933852 RepID=A0A0C3B395_SERVB|nr:hypothetical protein M408DRAFT_330431 [Serendipita vermifera MAFF 305830]